MEVCYDKSNKYDIIANLMVFVLSMSIYGLATLFTELVPSFYVGVVEFSIEYFLFIPLILAILFDPMSAALGAATGNNLFGNNAGSVWRVRRNRKIHKITITFI